MIVNPAPGVLVRDPVTSIAVEPGAEIDPNEPYWARQLADGDLVAADGAAPATPAAPAVEPARALPFSSDEEAA